MPNERRYKLVDENGRWSVYDGEKKRTLCTCMFKDNAEQIYDALSICHEYYDKVLDKCVCEISPL